MDGGRMMPEGQFVRVIQTAFSDDEGMIMGIFRSKIRRKNGGRTLVDREPRRLGIFERFLRRRALYNNFNADFCFNDTANEEGDVKGVSTEIIFESLRKGFGLSELEYEFIRKEVFIINDKLKEW